MNKGDTTAAALENANYKLVLAHVPMRCSTNTELHIRFKLRKDGRGWHLFLVRTYDELSEPRGWLNVEHVARVYNPFAGKWRSFQ